VKFFFSEKRAQHEAHRDGVVTSDNDLETRRAVLAHTEMALRVAGDYGLGVILGNQNLAGDAAAYLGGPEAFARYAGTAYDSSADYWKLVKNEDGTGSIVWDGKRDLTNEEGDLLQKDKTGSFSQSLMKYLGREETVKLLESQGYDTQGKSDTQLAYALMTTSGSNWNESNREYELIPTYGYQGSTLESRLSFDVTKEEAVNLGKIPQYSPAIAYNDSEGVNIMEKYGCFLGSILGAVQTTAGSNLTSEQILAITGKSFDLGYLSGNMHTGANMDKEAISALAFRELGVFKRVEFDQFGSDGSLVIGATGTDTWHAREGDSTGDVRFDPYPWVTYLPGGENAEIRRFNIINYSPNYYDFKYVQMGRY